GWEDGADVDVLLLEDDAVPDGGDTAPSGATHQLSEFARGERHEVPAIELREGRDNASPGWHVNAERERFGGEDDFDQATLEEILDQLLQVGQQPGMVHRQPAAQRFAVEEIEVQLGLVAVLDLLQALLRQLVDGGLLRCCRQVEAVGGAARQRLATAPPRKDEIDRRQEFPSLKAVNHRQKIVLGRPAQ